MSKAVRTVRVYFPYFPFPPSDGSAHVVYNQLQSLLELGFQVEFVCWKENLEALSKKRHQSFPGPFHDSFPDSVKVQTVQKGKGLGFLSREEPGFEKDPVGYSISRWIRVGYSLGSSYASPELYYYPPQLQPNYLEKADLGIYHYSFAYPWLKDLAGPPREKSQVVVFHNLESELFEHRAEQSRSKLVRWIHEQNAKKLTSHEQELAKLVKEVWFVSPADQKEWNERVHGTNGRLVGAGFSRDLRRKRRERFLARPERRGPRTGPVLGFAGALDFGPNLESALWLLDHLAPLLEAQGFKGKILMAGRGAPPELKRKAFRYPFIQILGFVPDLEDFWALLDCSLVPHITGSGVRIKLLESLASGVPTMATSAAVARIHPNLVQNELLWVSDDPKAWCKRIMDHSLEDLRRKHAEAQFPVELDSQTTLAFLQNWGE